MEDALIMVPTADSAENLSMRHVIGNKNDTHDGDSIMAETHTMLEHVHTASQVYPTLAGGVAVATAAGVWGLSAGFTEIVPINTITTDFDIHWICIEALDDNAVYEIVLYAATTEIGRVRVVKNAVMEGTQNIKFQCDIQPANTQIQAKAASSVGNSVATFSIHYHIYA
jgi:hypothetical protein